MSKAINKLKEFWALLKETYKNWNERDPFNKSIVIAWYTIFSLPGLLVVIINAAGFFYDSAAVTKKIIDQIQGMIGGDTAKDIEAMIATASNNKGTVISSILGIASMIFGATGVFYQLQKILNEMWGVRPKPKQAILKMIKDRVFSFGLILVIGFLLLVSLVLSAGMSAFSNWVSSHISESLVFIFSILDIFISIGVITVLFGALYKFLPDAKVRWKDVWVGSFLTSVLFVIAKFALGFYFGKSNPGSTYGAAGTIILIMLWVSYAGLILLFGAEFTQVYADKYGKKVTPTEGAEFIDAQKTEEIRKDRKENINAEGNGQAKQGNKDKKETWKM